MKQWDKWKCLWTAMATAQLIEMVLDPNYKPQAGEEKLCCQQLMYVYKVLLDTVLECSLRAILHRGEADTILKMWEEMVSKAEQSTEAKHYSKKIFDYLNTITWCLHSLEGGFYSSKLKSSMCQDTVENFSLGL
jgi:hypothetical protein